VSSFSRPGGALRLWPVFVLGHQFSGLVAIQPGHKLVIRHPSYLGLLVNALGWGLAFRSAVGVLLTALMLPPAPEFMAQHPEIPWADMRDMRNIVVHAYFDVQSQIVWRTVQEDLPKLKQQIDQLLTQRQPQHLTWTATPETDTEPKRDHEPRQKP